MEHGGFAHGGGLRPLPKNATSETAQALERTTRDRLPGRERGGHVVNGPVHPLPKRREVTSHRLAIGVRRREVRRERRWAVWLWRSALEQGGAVTPCWKACRKIGFEVDSLILNEAT